MKKLALCFVTITMLTTLVACDTKNDSAEGAFSIISDRVQIAKEVAESDFSEHMMNQSIDNYEIEETTYAFITNEGLDPYYAVRFEYLENEETKYYGYKIDVNDDNLSTIFEQGESVNEENLK